MPICNFCNDEWSIQTDVRGWTMPRRIPHRGAHLGGFAPLWHYMSGQSRLTASATTKLLGLSTPHLEVVHHRGTERLIEPRAEHVVGGIPEVCLKVGLQDLSTGVPLLHTSQDGPMSELSVR
jgi:hypothetical protein